jgi:hypothetical protein
VRPNARTLQRLAELRRQTLQGGPPDGFARSVSVRTHLCPCEASEAADGVPCFTLHGHQAAASSRSWVRAAWSLEGIQSLRLQVHVRHGDKWREAKETLTLTYFEKAQQLQVPSKLIPLLHQKQMIQLCRSF